MATIRITDLCLRAIIGVRPEERLSKQDIILNITVRYDSFAATQTDKLEDAFDYEKLTQKIIEKVENSQFFLLEKLTEFVLNIVMENESVQEAIVRIDKSHALRLAKSVSVELIKKREDM